MNKRTKKVVISMSAPTHALLKRKAQEKGLAMSSLLRSLIRENADKIEKRPPSRRVFVLFSEEEYKQFESLMKSANWDKFIQENLRN